MEANKKISNKTQIPSRFASHNDIIVGIEEDLLEIKRRLCGESSELQLIPIVGMGGIGKTTLARYAYNDALTIYHFDVRLWVTISQSYSLKKIFTTLVCSIKNDSNDENFEYMKVELLKEHVYKYLKGRRFLVVMDDMWDAKVWDDVRVAFPNDSNGSRIVITTRELDVASYIDTSCKPHPMCLMSVDRSWTLLREKVFGHDQEDCPLELEEIGKVVSEKCKGLPLAIVLVGGVLSKLHKMKESWEKIARNVCKVMNTHDDILSLSYTHLPPHLKPCFLYMGCFPEDHEINASKLIRLWGGEGFLPPNESREMEELGHEYLEDLVKRSLVMIHKKRLDGKIKTIKIHDLLRDLVLRKCKQENFLTTIDEFSSSFPQDIGNSNRISVFYNFSGQIPNMDTSPTYTILLFKNWAFNSWKSFRLLKVVEGLNVTVFTSTKLKYISGLSHLRYLSLACEPIRGELRRVSESLYHLKNLQTLIVKIFTRATVHFFGGDDCLNQWYMEFEIWRMPKLRHLILLDAFLPESFLEASCISLSNLHSLSRVKDLQCSETLLKMIPNLKKLGITYSYKGTNEPGWSCYSLTNLVHLQKLEKLSFYAEPYPNIKNETLSANIKFPVTLKQLTLSGCRFPWGDMTMIGSLPNLEMLKLVRRACDGTEWETSEGEFLRLRVLLIDGSDLHRWISDNSCFPMLERLTLYECESLREVPSGIGDIPTLQLIEVDAQNSALVESVKGIEEEQQSYGNEILQVHLLKSRSWLSFK